MSERSELGEVIKVGFVSGFDSPYGVVVKNQFKGAELAVAEQNAAGGLLGKRIELIPKDDKMQVDLAGKVTQELIDEGVDLLVGTLSAATVTEVNRVAKEAGIPLMGINQVSAITQAPGMGDYTFHECLTPYITAQLCTRWGLEHLGKRWLFIVPDYQWGYEAYESSQVVMQKGGGVDMGVIKIPLGSSEEVFASHMEEILRQKPDVLCVTNFGSDQINFIKAAHAAGIKKEMTVFLSISDLPIADAVGLDQLVGMYWGVNFYWGLADQIPESKKFVDSFRAQFPDDYPSGYAAYAYSGIKEFFYAVEASGEYPLNYPKMTGLLEGRTYNHYKGDQWWRPCDHQSFQDFYILRFKGPEESTHQFDIGEILGTAKWDLDIERTCEALGLSQYETGHVPPVAG